MNLGEHLAGPPAVKQPEQKGFFHKLLSKYKGKKKYELILIMVIIAAMIAIFASTFAKTQPTETSTEESNTMKASESLVQQRDELENQLEETLSQITGAGKVRVMITFETGPEMITAFDSDVQTSNTEEATGQTKRTTTTEAETKKPVTYQQQNGTQPLVITQKNPEIRGVIVVAEGAVDVRVKMDLLTAVQTVLNVDASCVDVFVMDNSKE
jgi:stage III sporulation protein AG